MTSIKWPNGFDAYLNPQLLEGAEIQAVQNCLAYTCWSWSLRTGLRAEFKGLIESETTKGAVVFRFDNAPAFSAAGADYERSHGFARYWPKVQDEVEANYAECVLGYQYWGYAKRKLNQSLRRTISHEFGHTVGIEGHLSDVNAVLGLRTLFTPLKFAPTWSDYKDVSIEGHSHTHIELTPDDSLFIPGIVSVQDPTTVMAVDLEYLGDLRWKLRHAWAAGQGAPVASVLPVDLNNPEIHMSDVRCFHRTQSQLAKVILVPDGEEIWRLHHAE